MSVYGPDIYTEAQADSDTLANLGPLTVMAGAWEGTKGADQHPAAAGDEREPYVEHYELEPIDPQTNGPQLFYGLRYHTHVTRPGEVETFHDQVGYWLWEPAAQAVTFTLGIPRGQVVLASGSATPDARTFELTAALGSEVHGILSNPFLHANFRTLSYRISVTLDPEHDSWSYESEGLLQTPGHEQPFRHVDSNVLVRTSAPRPNPLGRARRA